MSGIIANAVRFAEPRLDVERRGDGTLVLSSPVPLERHERCMGMYLHKWADEAPDRPFLLERDTHGDWVGVSYAQARAKVVAIATWLLRSKAGPEKPVVVLSDNSVEHGLLMLASMHAGIPYSSISPAYSLLSKDHAKLKSLVTRLDPGVIYVSDCAKFSPALDAISGLHDAVLVASNEDAAARAIGFQSLLLESDEALVSAAFARVDEDTVAKVLFTSGSTSEPKGVINTQRMLLTSQQGKAQLWPFLAETPPVLLDWLPWNHTFGSNHNFNLILMHGGTLHIDAGKPMPGMFDASIRNLREVRPTLYLNVPRGFEMLVPALRNDAALRKAFFSRLQVIFYAAAALPQHLWDALIEMSREEAGHPLPMVTAWGATETAPLATDCHYQAERSGVIGLPIPGVSLKLVPNGEKLEVRVKGPVVTPGYFKQPEVTAKAFDEEGYYLIGDAVRFVDAERPELGLIFDGRVAEDFKLTTGTWVSVGNLRIKAVEKLVPLGMDVVVTGHDRDCICFLIFPNIAACRQLAGLPAEVPVAEVLMHEHVRSHVKMALQELRKLGEGSSTYAQRALLMHEPPAVDAGEITDKGYINQGAVLKNRAHLVERLYVASPDAEVISL